MIQGRDCAVALCAFGREVSLPYSLETLREMPAIAAENPGIEGGKIQRAMRIPSGVTGCVETPLSIQTAPFLFAIALGETARTEHLLGGICKQTFSLVPARDGVFFDVMRKREKAELFEQCRARGFELRGLRDGSAEGGSSAVLLRLDIGGDLPPADYSVFEIPKTSFGERFKEAGINYQITESNEQRAENSEELAKNQVYGFSLAVSKEDFIRAEFKLHRAVGLELPPEISQLHITARLFRDSYCGAGKGAFRITLEKLVLISDDTVTETSGEVIGTLRYHVSGSVRAECFSDSEGAL